jgi:hypothetical protein
MFNSQRPALEDLPTSKQLLRATFIAAGTAAVLLAVVVLPSEYGVDPTGVGRQLGLTRMGEIKVQLAEEAALAAAAEEGATPGAAGTLAAVAAGDAHPALAAAQSAGTAHRTDTTRVTLAPGEAAEVKFTASKGTRVAFNWSVEGGHVNYDTHADAPGISYHGYEKGRESTGQQGDLVAAFDGSHGWFWRNRSGAEVTVTLRTEGGYREIKRVV